MKLSIEIIYVYMFQICGLHFSIDFSLILRNYIELLISIGLKNNFFVIFKKIIKELMANSHLQITKELSKLSRAYIVVYQIHLPFAHSPEVAGSFHNPDKTACSFAASHSHRHHHILPIVVAALVVGHHKHYLNFRNRLGYIKLIFNL